MPSGTNYLPLTSQVLAAHLSGDEHVGLYPLLDGDRCWWLAADFDGSAAMLDALNYVKAARAAGAPAGLEVSRSGIGAHAWIFFTAPVPAQTARRLGTGLLREAMALGGQMPACHTRRNAANSRARKRSHIHVPRASPQITAVSTKPNRRGQNSEL